LKSGECGDDSDGVLSTGHVVELLLSLLFCRPATFQRSVYK